MLDLFKNESPSRKYARVKTWMEMFRDFRQRYKFMISADDAGDIKVLAAMGVRPENVIAVASNADAALEVQDAVPELPIVLGDFGDIVKNYPRELGVAFFDTRRPLSTAFINSLVKVMSLGMQDDGFLGCTFTVGGEEAELRAELDTEVFSKIHEFHDVPVTEAELLRDLELSQERVKTQLGPASPRFSLLLRALRTRLPRCSFMPLRCDVYTEADGTQVGILLGRVKRAAIGVTPAQFQAQRRRKGHTISVASTADFTKSAQQVRDFMHELRGGTKITDKLFTQDFAIHQLFNVPKEDWNTFLEEK